MATLIDCLIDTASAGGDKNNYYDYLDSFRLSFDVCCLLFICDAM